MADHVGIGEINDDHIESSVLDGFHHHVRDAGGTHLRLQVVGGDLGRLHQEAIFPGKGLLHPAVEKICDVGVLFGLGDAQVAQIHLAHHVGENVVHRLRRDDHRQREFLVILGHADIFQILGDAVAGDRRVEIIGSLQVPARLLGEPAGAGESTSNLAYAVGAEVEAKAGIVVADGRNRLVALVDAHEGDDKFVGCPLVVGIFHALHGVVILAAFAVTVDHGVEGFGDAFPAAIAVHRVVAAADAGDLAGVVFPHFLSELFQISRAIGGKGIAAIHESVHEDPIHIVLLGHLQQGIEMRLIGVNPSVRAQAEQMQSTTGGLRVLDGGEQDGVREEFAILDHQLNAGAVHVNDTASSDIEMADLAVAHLTVGQADKFAAGLHERVGILAQQAIVGGFAGKRDGVGFGFGAVAPAVEDDEHKWLGSGHFSKSSVTDFERSMLRVVRNARKDRRSRKAIRELPLKVQGLQAQEFRPLAQFLFNPQ